LEAEVNFLRRIVLTGYLSMALAVLASGQGKKGAASTAPAASATPAAASAPSSSGPFESQMLAFGGLDKIAANVAKTVCSSVPAKSTIVIYDQTAFSSLQAYEAFIANVKILHASYKMLIPEPQHPTDEDNTYGIGASSTIDPFADATSLLSAIAIASNSESPGSITIPDSAMAITLTNHLENAVSCADKNLAIIYPPLFGSGSSSDYSSANIQTEIKKVDYMRKRAQASVDTLNEAFIGNHPSVTAGDPVLNSALTDMNGLYDSFLNSLLQINSGTGVIGSAAVIQGYQLATVLRGPKENVKDAQGLNKKGDDGKEVFVYPHPAYILLASITNAGGTMHDHKNIWTALWSGDKISYSGGLVVNVVLWNSSDTKPRYASVLRYRVPFTEIHAPSDTADVSVGDNLRK
jgi:hypothetical protein